MARVSKKLFEIIMETINYCYQLTAKLGFTSNSIDALMNKLNGIKLDFVFCLFELRNLSII